MIQLGRSAVTVDAADIDGLRTAFRKHHCVLIRGLIDPALLGSLADRVAHGTWRDRVHHAKAGNDAVTEVAVEEAIATEVVSEDTVAVSMLEFLVNNPAFIAGVRSICDSPTLGGFAGRIYRMVPSAGHHIDWHNDMAKDRLAAMSINLGQRPYTGGVLEVRNAATRETYASLANTGFGDAVLFRVSKDLEHHVTDVTGSEPKTAFAGWFQAHKPDMVTNLRHLPGTAM
jgi:hypothetical protein